MPTASKQLTVVGNVGTDAQLKHTSPKSSFKNIYDPMIDDVVEKPISVEAKPFVTFSIAETRDTPEGKQTLWYSVTSWNPNDPVKNLKKGDRVSVRGHFSKRTFTDKSGKERSELCIRLSELEVLRTKTAKQPHVEDVAA